MNINVCGNLAFQMRSRVQQGAPPLGGPTLCRADRREDLLTELPGILYR
jgi:hypothetical protein